MMVTHELKIRTEYFSRIITGQKTFEIRKNDRNYQVNDLLYLKEYQDNIGYSNITCVVKIVYIETYAQQEGYVVLGIEKES